MNAGLIGAVHGMRLKFIQARNSGRPYPQVTEEIAKKAAIAVRSWLNEAARYEADDFWPTEQRIELVRECEHKAAEYQLIVRVYRSNMAASKYMRALTTGASPDALTATRKRLDICRRLEAQAEDDVAMYAAATSGARG